MRLERLDLIRYGRFTDRSLALPRAERDFHLIVGPNEAGKSTVRAAVLDLLYGIPKNTLHAFLHAMPEMRLGARLSQGGQALTLQRVKGNKQTLRDAADQPLPDDALAPYLGSTDRDFFSQMFGLDHERLVKGGHSILSASNDLGQILFQSAAGIAGLGAVRDALEDEADKLWSRRKSGERAYYIAADDLERATAALKHATVRTRDWADAQAQVTTLDEAHASARQQHAEVRQRRGLLERLRRVLPHLAALDDTSARLAALGTVPELPDDAATTLAAAERALAAAQVDIDHQAEQVALARAALQTLSPDPEARAAAREITELNEQRLQYRPYAADIEQRQAECDAEWAVARSLALELGWHDAALSAELLLARLRSADLRASLTRLLRSQAQQREALLAATRAERAKRGEVAQARAELAALPSADPPLALQAALARAHKLGDVDGALRERREAVARRQAALLAAQAALGPWGMEAEALRAVAAPPAEQVSAFAREQAADDALARTLATRLRTLAQQTDKARLEVAQYRQAHDPVTRDDLLRARQQRDRQWEALKTDPSSMPAQAGEFEQQLRAADTLADRRHDTVQQASELQHRLDQLERTEQEAALAQQELAALQAEAEARAQRWSALAAGNSLPAMPFTAASAWLEARAVALAADSALAEARAALQATQADVRAAHRALALEGRRLGLPAEGHAADEAAGHAATDGSAEHTTEAGLAVLMLQADAHLRAATGISGQRRALEKQLGDGERQAVALQVLAQDAARAMDDWSTQWRALLVQAGLDAAAEPPAVELLLATIDKIETALQALRRIQLERIATMRADLSRHAQAAASLAQRLAPALASLPADEIALQLSHRLAAAEAAHQAADRHHATLRAANAKLEDATLRRHQAEAMLAPLLQRAGVVTRQDLPAAIAASDRRRALLAATAAAERATRDGGDGMTLAQLRTEAAGVNLAALALEFTELAAQEEALVERLTELSARRQTATAALQAMAGTADAARAEAQRQEALARMGEAVERYIKVFTAARLLRWAIERYREAKQGPMLASASRIFSGLTGGSFEKLSVDFDSEPLKLMGRRAGGGQVAIEGMSEGTRDQLFLALRLAALDLHLGQAQALPFVADDLFINYDDTRAEAGLRALGELSRHTQVLFLTHHDHLLPAVRRVFGEAVNVIELAGSGSAEPL